MKETEWMQRLPQGGKAESRVRFESYVTENLVMNRIHTFINFAISMEWTSRSCP